MALCLCHVTRGIAQTGGVCGTAFGFGIVVCSFIESLLTRGSVCGALAGTWVGGCAGTLAPPPRPPPHPLPQPARGQAPRGWIPSCPQRPSPWKTTLVFRECGGLLPWSFTSQTFPHTRDPAGAAPSPGGTFTGRRCGQVGRGGHWETSGHSWSLRLNKTGCPPPHPSNRPKVGAHRAGCRGRLVFLFAVRVSLGGTGVL